MSLKKVVLKKSYDSEQDDLLHDFYIPALTTAKEYCRIAGYFSSSIFTVASEGLAHFVSNGGVMKLICGVEISRDDYDALIKGVKTDSVVLLKHTKINFEEIHDEFLKDRLRILSWLIAQDKLRIKLAVIPSDKTGIFHEKIGIIRDFDGNLLSFSGSVNETGSGWLNNVEEFKVFRSWVAEENEYLSIDSQKFTKYWNGLIQNFRVIDLPEAIKEHFLKIKPEDFEFNAILERVKKESTSFTKRKALYEYQKEAIKCWVDNKYQGILEMATGTGKTVTALGAVNTIAKQNGKYFVIIAVPYKHLVTQWIEDINIELDTNVIIEAHSDSPKWYSKLRKFKSDFDDGFIQKVVVVTVYKTLSSSRFRSIFKEEGNLTNYMLIADEVHNMGASGNSRGMLRGIQNRLGLSATPDRWFDEEGTKDVRSYFSKTVYTYDMATAIKNSRLTPYEYVPHFIYLSDDELENYHELTAKIRKSSHTAKDDDRYLKMLLLIRSKIIKNCESKLSVFKNIIRELKHNNLLAHVLIYCDSGNQLEMAQKILNKEGVINHRFTQEESLDERASILKQFDEGVFACLVAMKCLDEGVNVPSTQIAIILASTTNPREYIQRRGRVLRKYPGKTKAIIHDFTVLPSISTSVGREITNIERLLIKRELNRVEEFLSTAENRSEVMNDLSSVMLKYQVYLG